MSPGSIPLGEPSPSIEKISAQLSKRLGADFPLPSFRDVPRATRDAARRFWSERAWSEYTAVPVLSQISIRMAAERASLGELSGVAAIIQDETLHTALSVSVAEAFGGYLTEIPEGLLFDPTQATQPSDLPRAEWLVIGCCVSETVSRALIQARLLHTREPALRRLVARTLKDENMHVAFGWAAAATAVRGLGRGRRRLLAEAATQAIYDSFRGPSVERLDGKLGKAERRLRQRVADAGLGSCPPDDETAAVRACVEHFIVPNLQRLGIDLVGR